MAKPNDDLSALFRSLRPDESIFQENIGTVARDAEQRWPLFKAVAPEKPQETPALSAQERQRWVNQEKPEFIGRKPALSLPGLSDKMSNGLDKMSARAVKNTAPVKPAVRRDPENSPVERVTQQPTDQARGARVSQSPQVIAPENRTATAAPISTKEHPPTAIAAPVESGSRPSVPAPGPTITGRDPTRASGRGDGSLKSIFGRLETKPETVAKPSINRSSFLDRLGKR